MIVISGILVSDKKDDNEFRFVGLFLVRDFLVMIVWYVHDKYVQREHQLLVNYPIIGRLRYLFEEVREPF